MQLASHGAARLPTARQALYRSVNRDVTRNIHYHIPNGHGTQQKLSSTGRRIFSQGKNLLSKFVGHLTAPGLGSPARNATTASIRTASRTTIQGRLSYPTRTTLASSPRMFMPRAPMVPRTVAQVGLGTARNFSSARPIFQHLVENVSVKGRALQEVELDLKGKNGRENLRVRKGTKGKKAAPKFDTKSRKLNKENDAAEENKKDLEHYFAAPEVQVTTSLHIPLAPTPTARVPLNPQYSPAHGSFLPLHELGSLHASHEVHSMRVSSLFARLDQANVWDQGVQCSAYSHLSGGQEGVCTILKVDFEGWTKEQVRSVIGESGSGWCAFEEVRAPVNPKESSTAVLSDGYDSDSLSETSSILSGVMDDESNARFYLSDLDSEANGSRCATPPSVDPAESVVLPTLDFSSSFVAAQTQAQQQRPELSRSSSFVSDSMSSSGLSDFDYLSDGGLSHSSNGSGGVVLVEEPGSSVNSSMLGFSAEFVRRAEEFGGFDAREEGAPMETLF